MGLLVVMRASSSCVVLAALVAMTSAAKTCFKPKPTYCTMVDWKVNGTAAKSSGKAELGLAVEVSGLGASEKCKNYYADMRCRQIYPKCDSNAPADVDPTVCRGECEWFKERCLTVQLDCSAFPTTNCYAGPNSAGFMTLPSLMTVVAMSITAFAMAL